MELCKKKQENCVTSGFRCQEVGDAYSYLAFKRDTQFFIGFVIGKWNEITCNEFYEMLVSRLRFPTRKTRSFAKRRQCIEKRLEFFLVQNNFIEAKKGETPAMKEQIVQRKMKWSEILHTRLTTSN